MKLPGMVFVDSVSAAVLMNGNLAPRGPLCEKVMPIGE